MTRPSKKFDKKWTTGDETILREMWNRGCDQREIGVALGRTPLGINSRIKQRRTDLGLMPHACVPLKAAQRKPIQREVELAIQRARCR
jgi:hypothetical protein